jgi:GDP-D-mannose dehydratase
MDRISPEFLLEKGDDVHGIIRRASSFSTQRIDHIYADPHTESSRFRPHYGELTDTSNLTRIIPGERDWGHARDHVRMRQMMLQQDDAEDFVIATGVQYTVREFILWSAAELGIRLRIEGNGVEEIGVVVPVDDPSVAINTGDVMGRVDPRYFRPAAGETLLGNPTGAQEKLGWVPEITAQEMCAGMVAEDLMVARRHALLETHGDMMPVPVEG